MRLETERMCERSLVKTRDGMKRQLEEVNTARQREVNEARAKAAALGRYGQLKMRMISKIRLRDPLEGWVESMIWTLTFVLCVSQCVG